MRNGLRIDGRRVGFPGRMSSEVDTDHPYWASQALSVEGQRTTKPYLIISAVCKMVVKNV